MGVGVGVESASGDSSKAGSGPRDCFEGVLDPFCKLALGVTIFEPGVNRGPLPILLFENPPAIDGRDGVLTGAGCCLDGDPGRGRDGRLNAGFSAGLAALAPSPTDWLKGVLLLDGVRPPTLKAVRPEAVGVAGADLLTAFSRGKKMPEVGFDDLK